MPRKRADLIYLDADREARGDLQVFRRFQVVKGKWHRNGGAARDQDFGMLVAQQMVQARKKSFDLILALRHLGRFVALQNIGAGGGRHAQCLDEQAR